MISTTQACVLLTRPHRASQRFASQLHDRMGDDLRIVISPVMGIEYLDFTLDTDGGTELVVTSQNAVEALGGRDLPRLRCFCVGAKTARAAAGLGLDAISADGDVDDLARLIVSDRKRSKRAPGRLLHIRGMHIAGDLEAALRRFELMLEPVIAYRQEPVALSQNALDLLKSTNKVVIPIFSPRSGRLLMEQFLPDMTAPRVAICLSRRIYGVLDISAFEAVQVCAQKDAASMLDCIASGLI